MIVRETHSVKPSKPTKSHKPLTLSWNGVEMVRNQSFLATVKEIIDYSEEMDVVRIGIIGDMMSGKSTLSKAIGHAIHKYSKTPFSVRVFYKEDLKNFKQTISKLKPTNYVLVFDDVSFLKATTSSQGISTIEDEVSTIRHLGDDPRDTIDVKIIMIFNFHYPKALPPFLREFHFKYVTSIGTDNERVIGESYGSNNIKLVTDFKTMRKRAITKKVWFEPLKNRQPLRYLWRNPFIPVLFWNEATMRKIVTPTREFMDKTCSTCEEAEGKTEYDESELPEIISTGERLFDKTNFTTAVKLLMHIHGIAGFKPKVERALKWIERERNIRNLPLSAIYNHYGFGEKRVRLDQNSDDGIKNERTNF